MPYVYKYSDLLQAKLNKGQMLRTQKMTAEIPDGQVNK